jgi:hypothetical protein
MEVVPTKLPTAAISLSGEFKVSCRENWRRGPGSNRGIKVLQTSPLPLGYRASKAHTRSARDAGHTN